MFLMRNKNLLVVFFAALYACGDASVEQTTPTQHIKQPLTKRIQAPKRSATPAPTSVTHTKPVHHKKTPPIKQAKTQSQPKRKTTNRWAYQAEQCHELWLKTAVKQAQTRDLGSPMPGRGGEYCAMKSYREALVESPQSWLGNFVLETGDGCREYDATLIYVFRRATYGKETKYFIPYPKRPKWLDEELPATGAIEPGEVVEIAALYKGDFIVYEIDYSKNNKILDVDLQAKRAMRQAIKSCFKQIGPSKPYHKVFLPKPTVKRGIEQCSW